ncbi:MAG: hypothetical protein WBX14_03275, partial [Candidatus Udaeobacter sp.]
SIRAISPGFRDITRTEVFLEMLRWPPRAYPKASGPSIHDCSVHDPVVGVRLSALAVPTQ